MAGCCVTIAVLSLFDGMSCGREALKRTCKPVKTYLAAEIDKYAIKIAQKNHPDNIQLGDVIHVRQMAEAGLLGWVDLLIGGSPCQGFSFAGKQLAFDDPRSALFFEFVRILNALKKVNPNIKFLLENVKMKKQHLDVISQFLGVQPIKINSALVSAQNRVRYYWCNWTVPQPADRGIYLRDIIETDQDFSEHILSDAETNYMNRQVTGGRTHWDFKHHSDTNVDKSSTLVANLHKGVPYNVLIDRISTESFDHPHQIAVAADKFGHDIQRRIYSENGKSPTLLAIATGGSIPPKILAHGAERRRHAGNLEIRKDEKSNALLSDGHQSRFITKRHEKNIKSLDDKSVKLLSSMHKGAQANGQSLVSVDSVYYRKLTCIECERLQTLQDGYTEGVSNTQRYKMIGNGWNVETIVHIFAWMPL